MNNTNSLKVTDVIDTRYRDDNGKVIPFSGDPRPCDVCGHAHEIHVHLSDGRIVGKTCALNQLGFRRIPSAKVRTNTKLYQSGDRVMIYAGGACVGSYRNLTIDQVAEIWAKDYPHHNIIKEVLA